MSVDDIITQLQKPIEDVETVLHHLSTLLDAYTLLPPKYLIHLSSTKLTPNPKNLAQIQRLLLLQILPTWSTHLPPSLIHQFFAPDAFSNASTAAGHVALSAYGVLLTNLSSPHALGLLERLVREYPVDRMYRAVWDGSGKTKRDKARMQREWEDVVRDLCMVPAKAANAVEDIPESLENRVYFETLSTRVEQLISSLSSSSIDPLAHLLHKLVNIGLFPHTHPTSLSRAQPSFFRAVLPTLRRRLPPSLWPPLLRALPSLPLQSILSSLFASLPIPSSHPLSTTPKSRTLINHNATLLSHLIGPLDPHDEAWDISVGLILSSPGREWDEAHARVFVAWVGGAGAAMGVDRKGRGKRDERALKAFLEVVLDRWASTDHIRHSLIARHQYTTFLLLLTLSYLSSSSPSSSQPYSPYTHLISHPPFIRGTSTYISHISPSVRRCGMLVAEEVARGAGRGLEFGGWEVDDDDGDEMLVWARDVRVFCRKDVRDVDVDGVVGDGEDEHEDEDEHGEVKPPPPDPELAPPSSLSPTHLSTHPSSTPDSDPDPDSDDDSLIGYPSHSHTPSSSRTPSPTPTPTHLASLEADPTLNIGVPRVRRPVYLLQLVGLVRSGGGGFGGGASGGGQGGGGGGGGGGGEPHEADKIQMALDEGEGLVWRKRGFGSELSETAITVVHAFLGLNDNFELDGFTEKRQGVVTALVVCCPEKAAPTLIEELFKNQYSIDQRFVVFNALALGARELAGLSNHMPTNPTPSSNVKFPSKKLPGVLHRKYVSPSDEDVDDGMHKHRSVIPNLVEGIVQDALSPERAKADGHPEIVRERRLRLGGGKGASTTNANAAGRIVEVEVGRREVLNPFSDDSSGGALMEASKKRTQTFIRIAAEHFICPLIARFWLFLRDAQTLHDRHTQRVNANGRSAYQGAGTSMLLHPLILTQFARSLAVLVHTAKNAPEWMALVGPAALEVAVSVGVRGVGGGGGGSEDDDGDGDGDSDDENKDEGGNGDKNTNSPKHTQAQAHAHASILLASLSLALTVLSCAIDLDGGRVLCLEHTELVLGCAEWAGKVFASLERGVRVREGGGLGGGGGGGGGETDLARTAAGVLLKIEEIRERWGVSMVDLR